MTADVTGKQIKGTNKTYIHLCRYKNIRSILVLSKHKAQKYDEKKWINEGSKNDDNHDDRDDTGEKKKE
jgi:hypothetical protein